MPRFAAIRYDACNPITTDGSPWQMFFTGEVERDTSGRWFAEVPELSGVVAHADSRDDSATRAQVLALRTLAELVERRESVPGLLDPFSVVRNPPLQSQPTLASSTQGVTDENLPPQVDCGPPVEREEW